MSHAITWSISSGNFGQSNFTEASVVRTYFNHASIVAFSISSFSFSLSRKKWNKTAKVHTHYHQEIIVEEERGFSWAH